MMGVQARVLRAKVVSRSLTAMARSASAHVAKDDLEYAPQKMDYIDVIAT
jgi:hypothetical protein